MKGFLSACVRINTRDIRQVMIDGKNDLFKIDKFSQEKFRELLNNAIIKHDLPFSFVDYEGIRDIFNYLNPEVKNISRNTAKVDVLRMHSIEAKRLSVMLADCPGRICLTSDLWTSIATDGYISVTAHFIDNDWKLHKRILNFSYMPPPYNGIALSDKIYKLLCSWGIEKKVFSLTLDNASANDVAIGFLRSQLSLSNALTCDGEYFHIRCWLIFLT